MLVTRTVRARFATINRNTTYIIYDAERRNIIRGVIFFFPLSFLPFLPSSRPAFFFFFILKRRIQSRL